MTADVKEALVEHIMRAALGAINKDQLASEVSSCLTTPSA